MKIHHLIVGFLLVLLLCTALIFVQRPYVVEDVGSHVGSPHVVGVASWDCSDPTPLAWVRIDYLVASPEWAKATIAHEMDHVDFMQSYGSCEAWQRAIKRGGKRLHLEMEARAYAVTAREARLLGLFKNLNQAVDYYAQHLTSPVYGFGLTHAQAVEAIWKHLKEL